MNEIKQLEARVKALEAKVFPAVPRRESNSEAIDRLASALEKKLDAIERQVRGK
tara:strand:- start:589 stop:750 length:162 start_codon:yes stop_codon:yes gene_type:complete